MCTVSNIGDSWGRDFGDKYPWAAPAAPMPHVWPDMRGVSREEFDKLRKEVESLKALLKAAKKFDEETGQPDCEVDEKVELIRRVAELVGVDMSEVFG